MMYHPIFLTLTTSLYSSTILADPLPAAAAKPADYPLIKRQGQPIHGPLEPQCAPPIPASRPGAFSLQTYASMNALCRASSATVPNAGCACVGTGENTLWCRRDGTSASDTIRHLCEAQCTCGDDTIIPPDSLPTDEWEPPVNVDVEGVPLSPWDPNYVGHTCNTKCSTVVEQCAWGNDCQCYAPKLSIFFWSTGRCGPNKQEAAYELANAISGKKKMKRQGVDPSAPPLTASTSFLVESTPASAMPSTISASTSSAAAPAATAEWEYQAQLIVNGLMPAPCNASYVSFACVGSTDGIVYESLDNWLGAIVPDNATEIPPVPQQWLTLNGLPANYNDPGTWTANEKRDVEAAAMRIERKWRKRR